MEFQTPLVRATLLHRYKRFLADVRLEDGREVTAHCPNPGAMLGLNTPGMTVWLEPNDDPRKKLKYGWRLSETAEGGMVGIDTGVPNKVVKEALKAAQISEAHAYGTVTPEVKYHRASRVDFLLKEAGQKDLYLEVKNAHLMREDRLAEFPDCVTARGARHMGDLADMVAEGHRAAVLFVIQRTDCDRFQLARDLDPAYGAAFDAARARGVEVWCYGTRISTRGVSLGDPIRVED